jgi:glyoxylase-like metal-dependent hydrolase (beta-lactamase superfamily II)
MRGTRIALVLFLVTLTVVPVQAQEWDDVEITTQELGGGVYMLMGRGGNMGLSVGEDGVFLVDDQYAPLTEKIVAAIRGITSEPVRFVLNTHWHGDHTGGNENLGEAGALLVAHENVRERLSVDQVLQRVGHPVDTTAASPRGAWPVVTFTRDVTFHLNGDDLHAFHVEHAHTDGDAIVHFRRANVVHMGDTFFRGRFPFIDTASGGSIDGLIAAVGRALAVMDAETQVIPGHGALATRNDLRAYRDALKTMRDRVAALLEEGLSLDAVLDRAPCADYAAEVGAPQAQERAFTETLYRSLGGR